jgi:SAM-dependent methyltransferase
MDLRGMARDAAPEGARRATWAIRRELKALLMYRGGFLCPICGNQRRFLIVNDAGGRQETLCLRCKSLERHRRTILLLRRYTDLFTNDGPLMVLHVAPEACLRDLLASRRNLNYVTADLEMQDVDVKLDLASIPFSDGFFDVVLCSHVLEHVPDDLEAISEMRRVVKEHGWALINVPADPDREDVDEDPSVADPAERLRRFGQVDHVRVYAIGTVLDRLAQAGFEVTVDPVAFTPDEQRRHLLFGDIGWDHSYFCRPRGS